MAQDTMKTVIDEDLKRRFKKACVDHDATMSEVVSALVSGWLQGQFVLQDTKQDVGQDTGQDK